MSRNYRQTVKLLRQYVVTNKQVHANDEKKKSTSKAVKTVSDIDRRLEKFLLRSYDFRYNLLTDETEFRPLRQADALFQTIGQRELNSMCMDAHEAGIPCWDRDLNRYIYSTRVQPYHPFRLYMDELPRWDGEDRLTELAVRVSDNPVWINGFRIWMRAMAAQWMGLDGLHANSVAPMLISREQGRLKSTFCKMLLPGVLERYYTDSLNLTDQGQPERRLAETGLINLDEFDKYPAKKMPLLKNLMQMAALNLRKAHQKNFRLLPRIASFIGTSNRTDLLTDPTGSRRFICVEVTGKIDCTKPDHVQLYAQLKTELEEGMRYWFTVEEEKEIQQNNAKFYCQNPVEEVLRGCYRVAGEGGGVRAAFRSSHFSVVEKEECGCHEWGEPCVVFAGIDCRGFQA